MVSRHESLEDWQLTEWMKTRKTFRIEKNYSEVYSIAATFRIQIEERKKEETLMNYRTRNEKKSVYLQHRGILWI